MKSSCYFIAASWSDSPVSQHFRELAAGLARHGHRVVMLIDGQRDDIESRENNPAIYTWPSRRPVKMRDAWFLSKLIDHYQPKCLIANFGATNVMSTVGMLMRVPHRICWYHTLNSQIDADSCASPWKVGLLRLRKRWVYRAASNVIANSEAARQDLQQAFRVSRSKSRVFHNSLADPLCEVELPHSGAAGARLACVGRLYPSKGQDILIKALVRLREMVPAASVEFIGDGPSRAAYAALARDLGVDQMCQFVGVVKHSEVLRRMAAARATVVPSRNEAFGLVNVESLAVGTPVVASRVGGIVEIIRDGMDGFLVPPDDPEALTERLAALLLRPALREEMSRNARERFLEHFEQQGIVSKQVEWLEEMVVAGDPDPV